MWTSISISVDALNGAIFCGHVLSTCAALGETTEQFSGSTKTMPFVADTCKRPTSQENDELMCGSGIWNPRYVHNSQWEGKRILSAPDT